MPAVDPRNLFDPESVKLQSIQAGIKSRPREGESFGDLVQREQEISNIIVADSIRSHLLDRQFEDVPGYNPYQDEDLTGYEEFDAMFDSSRSPEETRRIKSLIDQQRGNREVLSEQGGFVVGAAAEFVNPLNYVPIPAAGVGVAGRIATAAGRNAFIGQGGRVIAGQVAKGFARGAAINAAYEVGRTEILESIDPTRSEFESNLEIGFAGILGGAFGGIARYWGIGRQQSLLFQANIEAKVGNLIERATRTAQLPDAEALSRLPAASRAAAFSRAMQDFSGTEWARLTGPGTWIGRAFAFGFRSPGLRLAVDDLAQTRLLAMRALDQPFLRNIESFGPSVESMIKRRESIAHLAIMQLDETFTGYRKKHGGREIRNVRDFARLVGRAARRQDNAQALGLTEQSAIDAVTQAAQDYRRFVNALTEDGIEAGIIQATDLQSAAKGLRGTAPSWVTRLWNHAEVGQRRSELEGILSDWWIQEGVPTQQAQRRAQRVVENILSSPEGRVPINLVRERGPFKDRQLLINDELIEPFLENDIRRVMVYLSNTLVPDIEIAREFTPALGGFLGEILERFQGVRAQVEAGARSPLTLFRRRVNDLSAAQQLRWTGREENRVLAGQIEDLIEQREDLFGQLEKLDRALEAETDFGQGLIGPSEAKAKALRKALGPKVTETRKATARRTRVENRLADLNDTIARLEKDEAKLRADLESREGKTQSVIEQRAEKVRQLEQELTFQIQDEIIQGRPIGTQQARIRARLEKAREALSDARLLEDGTLDPLRRQLRETTDSLARRRKRVPGLEEDLVEAKRIQKNALARMRRAAKKADVADAEVRLAERLMDDQVGVIKADMDPIRAELKVLDDEARQLRTLAQERTGAREFSVLDPDGVDRLTQRELGTAMRQAEEAAGDLRRGEAMRAVTFENEIEAIKKGYELEATKLERSGDKKGAARVRKQSERRVLDVRAINSRLRNLAHLPPDPANVGYRIGRGFRRLNYVTGMGGVVLSSLPDVAMGLIVNGFGSYARGLWFRVRQGLSLAAARNKEELLRMVNAMEMSSGLARAKSLFDLGDDVGRHATRFEQGLDKVSDLFTSANLIGRWNSTMKATASIMSSDRILRSSLAIADGKELSRFHRNALKLAGITDEAAKAFAREVRRVQPDGTRVLEVDGGVHLARTQLWQNREARRIFEAAVIQDVDRTIVTPGAGDLPRFIDHEVGRVMLQFKSFGLSAVNRVLLSGLQRHDSAVASGMLALVGMGMLTYWAKQFAKNPTDPQISDNPGQWVFEGVDRSGILGIVADVNGLVERLSMNRMGFGPALDADPLTRHQARDWWHIVAGPSLGKGIDIGTGIQSLFAEGSFTDGDVRRLRRLMPLQNLFYLQHILSRVAFDPLQESFPSRRKTAPRAPQF